MQEMPTLLQELLATDSEQEATCSATCSDRPNKGDKVKGPQQPGHPPTLAARVEFLDKQLDDYFGKHEDSKPRANTPEPRCKAAPQFPPKAAITVTPSRTDTPEPRYKAAPRFPPKAAITATPSRTISVSKYPAGVISNLERLGFANPPTPPWRSYAGRIAHVPNSRRRTE